MSTSLLRTRRFLPLFLTQALGALNDNVFKNALVVLVVFRSTDGAPALVAAAGGLFILPYALFSAMAGQLADKLDKSRLIQLTKGFEAAIMALAAWGFLSGNVPALLAVLFGLGTQAAFFGPLKYGILPEQLRETELLSGNALIEAGTFGAILLGTIAGGVMIGLQDGPAIVSAAGLAIAALGLAAALLVPRAAPADPGLRIGWNVPRETLALLRAARANRPVWLSILGLSWFWAIGATFLAEFPVMARQSFGGDTGVITLLLTGFAVGVGAGSILAGRLLHGEVSARHVPFAGLLLSLFTWGFAALASRPAAAGWATPWVMLQSPAGLGAVGCLLGAAACGGVFSVPLYAIIQERSAPAHRARMIAGNNIMNAVFMVIGAGVIAGLAAAGMRPAAILAVAGGLNLLVAGWIMRLLPADVLRALFQAYFRRLHGITVVGLENIPPMHQRAVVVSNHTSLLDGMLLAAFLPGRPTFAVDTFIARAWWVRPFLAPVEIMLVDPTNPYAARDMVHAVRDGARLVIFPEGRITRTGGLMKMYDGAGMVADKADAVVVPVRIDGLQYSRASRMGGKLRLRWFPPVRLTVLPPVRLQVDAALQGRVRRRALGAALGDVLVGAEFATRPIDRPLFAALLDAAGTHGLATPIVEDTAFTPLSFRRLLLGVAALGRPLAALSRAGEAVGLLLPNASGTAVTFFALQAQGRVPAMLNYSAGAAAMLAACSAAGVRTVLCSRVFVEKGKLQKVVAAMEGPGKHSIRFVWLEDVRAGIGRRAKLRAWWDARRPRRMPGARLDPNLPAVILFTSGSEGAPKGVVLSHRNLLANLAQVGAVIDFSPADRVLNAMPMFHSFGLTGGTLLPILAGVRTFLYPSPLHYRIVPEVAYGTDATVTFGTDSFLTGWARFANPYDFRTMRFVIAGAEKVKEETRRTYADRYGARILEGYGTTETAPVLAVNTPMHNRPGTVGRLLPGLEYRLEPVAGIDHGGRLWVHGPNIMLGYLRTTAPGVLETLEDGWYDTGDIVDVQDRYVTILGRAKRFAKVAGEMVSMTAAEALATSLWPDAKHAVLAQPDPRKGEQLVLLTTQAGADARALLAHARAAAMAELAVPRVVLGVEAIPLLGSGKVDYPGAAQLLESMRGRAEAHSLTGAAVEAD